MGTIDPTPPSAALAELKDYLRVEGTQEDALLSALLGAATETVEAMLGQLMVEREVVEQGVVRDGVLALPAEPVRRLIGVEIMREDGTSAEVAAGETWLRIDAAGTGRLEAPGLGDGTPVRVRYRAGKASDWNWVPEILRLSVIRVASHFHAHRDAPEDPGVPPAVRRMLAPWRTRRIR